jgi:hypothetical protein
LAHNCRLPLLVWLLKTKKQPKQVWLPV